MGDRNILYVDLSGGHMGICIGKKVTEDLCTVQHMNCILHFKQDTYKTMVFSGSQMLVPKRWPQNNLRFFLKSRFPGSNKDVFFPESLELEPFNLYFNKYWEI